MCAPVGLGAQVVARVTPVQGPVGLADGYRAAIGGMVLTEDGSSFECTHADPKESACCVTNDPETVPLRATFTATPCAL